jgi:hypothetical protein
MDVRAPTMRRGMIRWDAARHMAGAHNGRSVTSGDGGGAFHPPASASPTPSRIALDPATASGRSFQSSRGHSRPGRIEMTDGVGTTPYARRRRLRRWRGSTSPSMENVLCSAGTVWTDCSSQGTIVCWVVVMLFPPAGHSHVDVDNCPNVRPLKRPCSSPPHLWGQ